MQTQSRWMSGLRLLGILWFVAVLPAFAAERRAMTVDDMLDMVGIGEVVMTPDGSRVFYSEREAQLGNQQVRNDALHVVPSSGGEAMPFVRRDGGETFRIYHPMGSILAMLREVEDKPQLFLMALGGGESVAVDRLARARSPTTNGRATARASSSSPRRL